MKVFILSAYKESHNNFAFQNVKKSSSYDSFKNYVLVENPQDADFIIFVEHHPWDDPYFFNVFTC